MTVGCAISENAKQHDNGERRSKRVTKSTLEPCDALTTTSEILYLLLAFASCAPQSAALSTAPHLPHFLFLLHKNQMKLEWITFALFGIFYIWT